MTNALKTRVLFLCTGNSARSQMAEAILKYRASDKYDVYSAGTHPEQVDKRAIAALQKMAITTQDLAAKDLSIFAGQKFDYVITLCDKANSECRSYPGARQQLAWDFIDPKSRQSSTAFDDSLQEINNRISMFLLVDNCDAADFKQATSSEFALTPTDFYKTLTDDIRLKSLMLTHYHGELCVCELMVALEQESQPKVSRNLAVLKKAQILTDRKHGQWVFYRINPDLPLWAKTVIAQTTEHNVPLIMSALQRLKTMNNRPDKASFCQ
ncbi:metalloregulator ArsR/SmtB family transcription factor [Litorilituus sediminis]|uniref:ArsR family transcriptional regulator n=1 Tax=Litorilituus sediminis TaxID=718192 RepID=A0A4P6P700_9GAMM|nr:metalloregulator ArsR/SmtB family transcription factor [Litorilituus sediminis]QBG37323.1 ArsR family transcriptional regulator [Litorilituus sediminis]